MKEIINALGNIQKPGSFFSKGSVAAENLSLAIAGQNQLKWPLSKQAARQLISLAKPACFGWRDKTLLDKKIRDVWEISPKNIRIGNKTAWDKTLLSALNTVKADLGLSENAKIQAKLHNLLIYEPGQFFHPHQDSEKYDGMVATMVIVLPSAHTGGGLMLDHQGEKKVIQSSRFSSESLNFIAFYADCYHEVKPVKTGYRVALTYNLILENTVKPSKKIDQSNSTKNCLIQPLRDFFALDDDRNSSEVASKCVYLLDHQYTKAGLSWHHLKNIDRLRAAALKQAADQLDLNIYLALADIHECWNCEGDYDDYWSNRRYSYDIDNRKIKEYRETPIELVDLIEESISLRHWVDRDGNAIDLAEYSANKDEIGWTKATDAFKPFESEYEGWMGNYGNTLDRWYHRAAIVLWKKADHYRVLFQIDPDRVMDELITSTKSKASPLPIAEILTSLLPLWSKYISSQDATVFKKVLQLAMWVENPERNYSPTFNQVSRHSQQNLAIYL